jgi:hypothetical protein
MLATVVLILYLPIINFEIPLGSLDKCRRTYNTLRLSYFLLELVQT